MHAEQEEIIIRFAKINDIDKIIMFIKEYWKEDHIFVKDRSFFKYTYVTSNERVNFVLGIGAISGKIYGIRGFICSNLNDNPDAWGAIWRKAPYAPKGFGRKLQLYLIENLKPRILAGVGLSKEGLRAREKLNEQMGRLNHYYRLANKDEYRIAVVKNKSIPKVLTELNYTLIEIQTMDRLREVFDCTLYSERRFYKDDWYIERRYFMYPYYKYRLFGICKENANRFDSILITRDVEHNNSKILRIVDFIGIDQDLEGIYHAIDQLINKNGYEYVDFYQHGISDNIMKSMGMTLRSENDVNIIPNYFEPFFKKNIEIDFSATDITNLYVFKGDSDQDRPNKVLNKAY